MENDYVSSASVRQPHSLKSLASYKFAKQEPEIEPEIDEANTYDTYLNMQRDRFDSEIDPAENEMQNASVKFVDVDSDLSEIFSRNRTVSFQDMKQSPTPPQSDDLAALRRQLKDLEVKNNTSEHQLIVECEKNAALRQELDQMENDMKALRADFREKEDQVYQHILCERAHSQFALVKTSGTR
jgi:predicted  nucleic acid-binding Zn-ribbon protein